MKSRAQRPNEKPHLGKWVKCYPCPVDGLNIINAQAEFKQKIIDNINNEISRNAKKYQLVIFRF